jgi:hypothetical protein
MNRRNILSLSAIAALGLSALPGNAVAQTKSLKEQLTGTWIVVTNDSVAPNASFLAPIRKASSSSTPPGTTLKSSC